MSTTKKVLIIIATIILLAAFIGAVVWGVINWSKLKEGMKGSGLYTQEDIQKSYEDGFNKALSDKEEYEKLINSYKDTITTQNDLISKHTSEVAMLNNTIKENQDELKLLIEQRTNLETQITTLNTIKTDNERTISELNRQIENLSNQVIVLQGNATENATQIETLNNQITNLQSINSQLQSTNELNTQTINNLNAQNTALINRITEITYQLENHSTIVASLNTKIAELQQSVQYYEQFIKTLEQGEQVIATFEFNGSVYNIQVVNKNSILTVTTPESTEYVIFNGWTIDGEIIDLATFRISENTRIIANITLKFDIKFMANGESIQNSNMLKDSKITPPTAPIKSGYVFDGWTIDGTNIINFDTYKVSQNVTFTAKYTKQYLVKFEYDGTIISNQQVKAGNFAIPPETISTNYKVFNGWKINNILVDIANYKINDDIKFVADITYKYDVTFMVDDEVYNSQIVTKNDIATAVESPAKDGFVFDFWSIDGINKIDVNSYRITETTTFIAKFKEIFTVEFIVNDQVYNTQSVVEGDSIDLVENPTQDWYNFVGWTTNGNDIVENIEIATSNIQYFAKFMPKGAKMLGGYDFNNKLVHLKTPKHIVFDKYNDNNKYFVNGVNVIANITPENVTAEDSIVGSIEFYYVNNTAYFLSNQTICFNEYSRVLFSRASEVVDIKFNNIDTSEVTNMASMFESCASLTNLDLSMFDTRKVTNMYDMFGGCEILTNLNISSFNTSNVTDMGCLFAKCKSLTNLDVSNFNTEKVKNMSSIFDQCESITFLDISNFNTKKVTSMSYMFRNDSQLVRIIVGKDWSTDAVTSHTEMFKACFKLPNYDRKVIDITNAHTNSGGYLSLKG